MNYAQKTKLLLGWPFSVPSGYPGIRELAQACIPLGASAGLLVTVDSGPFRMLFACAMGGAIGFYCGRQAGISLLGFISDDAWLALGRKRIFAAGSGIAAIGFASLSAYDFWLERHHWSLALAIYCASAATVFVAVGFCGGLRRLNGARRRALIGTNSLLCAISVIALIQTSDSRFVLTLIIPAGLIVLFIGFSSTKPWRLWPALHH